jgi:hypothetical protein
MITELTESQKNKLADYVREWTAIGLSCEPANRAEAESAADEAYRAAGLWILAGRRQSHSICWTSGFSVA